MIQQLSQDRPALLELPFSFERPDHQNSDPVDERALLVARLARKKNKVIKLVGAITKTGHNEYDDYSFVEEAEVVRVLRSAMVKAGLSLSVAASDISLMNTIKAGPGELSNYTVKMTFTLVDTETGYSQSYPWLAMGSDQADKALYKAYTSGVKYFLLKTFLLPTDDDVEHFDTSSKEQRQNTSRDTQPEPPPMSENSARIMDSIEEHFRRHVPHGATFDRSRFHAAVWEYFGVWPSVSAAARRIREVIDVKEVVVWGK